MVLNRRDISLELRCIQLGESLQHAMPKFGSFRLNGLATEQKQFKVPPPPNDRKRKDRILDLTDEICRRIVPRSNESY